MRTWPPFADSFSLTGAGWTPFQLPLCTMRHAWPRYHSRERESHSQACTPGWFCENFPPVVFTNASRRALFRQSLSLTFFALAFLLQSCGLDRPLVGQAHLLHHLLQAKGEPVSAGGMLRCKNNIQDIIPHTLQRANICHVPCSQAACLCATRNR